MIIIALVLSPEAGARRGTRRRESVDPLRFDLSVRFETHGISSCSKSQRIR